MAITPFLSNELDNGLIMTFVDKSKKIAADRWYVCIRVRISIPVERKWFAHRSMDDQFFKQIVSLLGDEVVFSQKQERNFVSDDEKENIINDICSRALELGSKYYTKDDFAAKYILKEFADQQKQI